MSRVGEPLQDETIGSLFSQLIDDGGDLVRAEINLYRQLAYRRALASRMALLLVTSGVAIAFGSVAAMLVGLVLGLAQWIGPVGSGIVVGLSGLLVAALLLYVGSRRFKPFSETPDEGGRR